MIRGLRREIAAAEVGDNPFKAAQPKVPKVKMTGHFRRPGLDLLRRRHSCPAPESAALAAADAQVGSLVRRGTPLGM